jgi:transcriptional regulator with XRE-family HTH domain
MEKIGQKIRGLRELRNYTQDYIAEKLNITQQQYSNIEKGHFDISVGKLYKIAEALDVPPSTILDFDAKVVFNNYAEKTHQNNHPVYHVIDEKIESLYKDKIKLLEEKIAWLEAKK